MPRAVRKVVSFLAYFGLLALVGLACANQLSRMDKRLRGLERRVDDVILDIETEHAVHSIRDAVKKDFASEVRKPWLQLVKWSAGEG